LVVHGILICEAASRDCVKEREEAGGILGSCGLSVLPLDIVVRWYSWTRTYISSSRKGGAGKAARRSTSILGAALQRLRAEESRSADMRVGFPNVNAQEGTIFLTGCGL